MFLVSVQDLSVIEVEVFGVPDEIVTMIRNLSFVDALSIEDRDQKQTLRVQSKRDSEGVQDLLASLDGIRVGRVTVQEPTLEDAYVRLVGGMA